MPAWLLTIGVVGGAQFAVASTVNRLTPIPRVDPEQRTTTRGGAGRCRPANPYGRRCPEPASGADGCGRAAKPAHWSFWWTVGLFLPSARQAVVARRSPMIPRPTTRRPSKRNRPPPARASIPGRGAGRRRTRCCSPAGGRSAAAGSRLRPHRSRSAAAYAGRHRLAHRGHVAAASGRSHVDVATSKCHGLPPSTSPAKR